MANFTDISSKYEKDSVVQKSASEILFELLKIGPKDDVLDLGCGTGHISKTIREKTTGRIVGVDPSKGMIEKAKEKFNSQNISFQICTAEDLDYQNEFDIVFCNSAFQWFTNPVKALKACHNSLKANGKMAIQAPAKDDYCPSFLRAISAVKKHKATQNTFSFFKSPWFFRNTSIEYTKLFTSAGFRAKKSIIDEVVTNHTTEEAYNIFESGAAAGYLNQAYYNIPLSQDYIDAFRDIVRGSFENQADKTGKIKLIFYRIYLLAVKSKT